MSAQAPPNLPAKSRARCIALWCLIACSLMVAGWLFVAVTSVRENKKHYAAAEAQALTQPKMALPGFMRTFVSTQIMGEDRDD